MMFSNSRKRPLKKPLCRCSGLDPESSKYLKIPDSGLLWYDKMTLFVILFKGLRKTLVCLSLSMFLLGAGCATSEPETAKKRARALEDLGINYLREGNPNLAVRHLMEAAELDAENPHVAHSLALAYRDLGLFDRSIAEFKRALALKPDFPQATNNMGVTYLLMRRWDDAIACFEKAAGNISYSTPHYAFMNLGLTYYQKGDFTEAVSYFNEALRIDPSFSMAYENLGLAYEALGEWDEARAAYRSSISHEPDTPDAYLLLGRLDRRLGRNAVAAASLQKAVELDPVGPIGKEARGILREMGVQTVK